MSSVLPSRPSHRIRTNRLRWISHKIGLLIHRQRGPAVMLWFAGILDLDTGYSDALLKALTYLLLLYLCRVNAADGLNWRGSWKLYIALAFVLLDSNIPLPDVKAAFLVAVERRPSRHPAASVPQSQTTAPRQLIMFRFGCTNDLGIIRAGVSDHCSNSSRRACVDKASASSDLTGS
ncbi:hypothetical protein BDW66DRAFT_1689 [Aspergillus desertorum]